MKEHVEWIQEGFDAGVFLVVGSLRTPGGGILAHNTSLAKLKRRVRADPLVRADIVTAEIIEIRPSQVANSIAPFLK